MAFKKIYTQDKNLQLIQDNIDEAIRPLQNSQLSRSVLIRDVTLKPGQDNLVAHGLNRTPIIFIVAALNANSTIWSQSSSQLGSESSNERLINIRCSLNCTASFIFA